MTRQFHDLIDMTRLDTGKLRLEPAPLEVAALLARCIAMLAGKAAEKSIALETRLARTLPMVHAENGDLVAELQQKYFDQGITGPEGQAAIAGYTLDGEQLFFPNAR